MSNSRLLQNIYLFKTLDEKEIDKIAGIGESKPLTAGDTIFLRGEPAKALYLIKTGAVKIQQGTKSGDTIDVATLGPGSHFGEMAFVDGEVRSATAAASDRGELFMISYDKLNQLLQLNPGIAVKVYRELARFLAGRLRVTTSDLSFAKEKNLSHM